MKLYTLFIFYLLFVENSTLTLEEFNLEKFGLKLIKEGTKWCGKGNIAKSFEDLGKFAQVDNCCRDHDHCGDYIVSRGSKYGLINKSHFTISHCDCDLNLFNCLGKVNGTKEENVTRDEVLGDFFYMLNLKCFDYTFPARCVAEEITISRFWLIETKITKCIQYEYNERATKSWQLFDSPRFK